MQLGEEYQNPLIVTGKLSFGSESRSGFTRRDRYTRDAFNRPQLQRSQQFSGADGFYFECRVLLYRWRNGTHHSP